MKKLLFLLILISTHTVSTAQEITGDWYGVLKVAGQELNLIIHISETEDGYTSIMDSPQQNAFGIPVASTTFENQELLLKAPAVGGMLYEGTLKGENIFGTFKQGGMEIPLDLYREKPEGLTEVAKIKRPQEPEKPYPYLEEEIRFENTKDSVILSGTLTLPEKEGNFPAVVLISGSGAQDRNEEVLGHKPFLVISDYLTRHGIAVLRYDDRGVGESTGNFSTATTADFANDTRAAVAFLRSRKEINSQEIGLIGHSEGGMIAPIIAAEDDGISFLVLMAGPGLRGDKLLLIQQDLIYRAKGKNEESIQILRETNKGAFDILNSSTPETLERDLRQYIQQRVDKDSVTEFPGGMDRERFIKQQVESMTNPWMHFFLTYDPSVALKKVEVPVLAINGEKDLQVSPDENLTAIEMALKEGGNDQITIIKYPGLNHLFQESTTGSPDEYGKIEQTFSPKVLEDMKNWILKVSGNKK